MATYGYDFYGKSKYGASLSSTTPDPGTGIPNPGQDPYQDLPPWEEGLVPYYFGIGIEPFRATTTSFTDVVLTWRETNEDWSQFRILRSRSGYAINEIDGQLVYEQDNSTPTPQYFLDSGLPGGWHYYTIYLLRTATQTWERAAIEDVLVPYDYRSADALWDRLPQYYKEIRSTGIGISPSLYSINSAIYLDNVDTAHNKHLAWFLRMFGWGFDIVRSHIDTIREGYDTNRVHISRLQLLADQFGAELERSVPASNNRNMVRNLGLLYRKRGTLDGIRELLALATGWNVDVSLGPNLMLNQDQADFASPQVMDWDRGTRYVAGDHVLYNNYIFEAKVTAYGTSQRPPSGGTGDKSNTWWTRDVFDEPKTVADANRDDTGDVSTWQVLGPTGPLPFVTKVAKGSPDPLDGTDVTQNALAFSNTTGATADLTVRSVPFYYDKTVLDRQLTIESGIPVPRPLEDWRDDRRYRRGEMVTWRGVPYEAQTTTENEPSTTDWKALGYDSRVRMALSFYAHGPFNGTPGTGGVLVRPHIIAFNEVGDVIQETVLDDTTKTNITYDPLFSEGDLDTRTTPVGTKAWATTGNWNQGWNSDGGFVYPSGTARVRGVVDSGIANGNVGITYRSVGTRDIGLAVRWTDDSNYYRADATELVRVQAGVATVLATYESFDPDERMRVSMNGGTITVYKNDLQVGQSTGQTFNQTATRHGIVVEA